jgi:hypothetical protein
MLSAAQRWNSYSFDCQKKNTVRRFCLASRDTSGNLSAGVAEVANWAYQHWKRLRNGDKNKLFAKSNESISPTCHRIEVADSGSFMKRIW